MDFVGGVDISRIGNGGTGMDEVRRILHGGEASLRGVIRGHGFTEGLCSCEATLQGGTWGEVFRFAEPVAGVRAVSLRGVKPGVRVALKGKTIDKGEITFF